MKKDSANIAMESIIGANLFEKDGVTNCMKAEEMFIIRRGEGCLSLTTINNRINIHRLSGGYLFVGVSYFYIDCTE